MATLGGRTLRRSPRTSALNGSAVIDHGNSECATNYGDNGRKDNSDDSSLDGITLRELKAIFKGKKRKVRRSHDQSRDDLSRRQDHDLILVKEEPDLEEPLICWKVNLAKKSKVERKLLKKETCSMFPHTSLKVSSELESNSSSNVVQDMIDKAKSNASVTHEHLPQNTGSPCTLNEVKTEIAETDLSNVPCVPDLPTNVLPSKLNLFGDSSAKLPERVDEDELETAYSASYAAKLDLTEYSVRLPNRTDGAETHTGESISSMDKMSHSCLDGVSTQFGELTESIIPPENAENISGVVEITGSLVITDHELITSCISECKMGSLLFPSFSDASMEAASVAKDPDSRISGNSENCPPQEKFCQMHSSCISQMLDVEIDCDSPCMELAERSNPDPTCNFDGQTVNEVLVGQEIPTDISKEDPSDCEDGSASASDDLYAPDNSFHSFDDGSYTTNTVLPSENTEEMSVKVVEARKFSTDPPDREDGSASASDDLYTPEYSFHSFDVSSYTTNTVLPSENMEEMSVKVVEARKCTTDLFHTNGEELLTAKEALDNYHDIKIDCPPKKLLSTRKAISPTSQEKLRQAVDAEELPEGVHLSKTAAEDAQVIVSPIKSKRLKNSRSGCPSSNKGILKSSHIPCVASCTCTDCTSIHTQMQKAAAFSEQQMRDLECLAMKLMKGLKSMRNIVEDSLLSEACPATPSKYTADEIRRTAMNAVVLEGSAKKWLSMMSRDTSRFCKIMKSTNIRTATTSPVPKERKKITFADEAGGTLCHVKVYEEDTASHSVSEDEKDGSKEQA